MNDTSGLKRTASTTSRISQKSTKGVGTDDLDDPAGVITDQYGTRFRFKRRSTYEPLLTSSVDTDGGGGRIERRRSSAMQRSAGAGIAGPLIVAHLLSDEDEVSEGEEEEGSVMSMGSEHGGKKGGARRRKKIRLLGCIGVTIGCVLGSGEVIQYIEKFRPVLPQFFIQISPSFQITKLKFIPIKSEFHFPLYLKLFFNFPNFDILLIQNVFPLGIFAAPQVRN